MVALGSHINVHNTCLILLRKMGFDIRLEPSDDDDVDLLSSFWVAQKGDYDLWADNPLELLGLARIYEHHKPKGQPMPYWWRIQGAGIYDEVVEARWPDDDEA